MPETYSHSRLATFETCRRQYRYRYIDRLPRQGMGIEAHTGTAVHKALEELYGCTLKGLVPSLKEVTRRFLKAWEAVPPRQLKIVRTGFLAEDYRRLGMHCLEGYYRQFQPFNQAEVLAMESRVDFFLDSSRQQHMVGFIDRVDRAADGFLEIHDYKTSASMPRSRDLDADRQLTLYEMGLRRRYPDAKGFRQVWHYLTFLKTFVRTRQEVHQRRTTRACQSIIRRIGEERAYEASTSTLCHWCDYHAECPEGRNYLRLHQPPGLAV